LLEWVFFSIVPKNKIESRFSKMLQMLCRDVKFTFDP
jgi:hypothetical protein